MDLALTLSEILDAKNFAVCVRLLGQYNPFYSSAMLLSKLERDCSQPSLP